MTARQALPVTQKAPEAEPPRELIPEQSTERYPAFSLGALFYKRGNLTTTLESILAIVGLPHLAMVI